MTEASCSRLVSHALRYRVARKKVSGKVDTLVDDSPTLLSLVAARIANAAAHEPRDPDRTVGDTLKPGRARRVSGDRPSGSPAATAAASAYFGLLWGPWAPAEEEAAGPHPLVCLLWLPGRAAVDTSSTALFSLSAEVRPGAPFVREDSLFGFRGKLLRARRRTSVCFVSGISEGCLAPLACFSSSLRAFNLKCRQSFFFLFFLVSV